MSDLLNMDFISSLPHPLWIRHWGEWWPVYDIEVQTGLLRIDACGMLDVMHIDSALYLKDASGKIWDTEDFYLEDLI